MIKKQVFVAFFITILALVFFGINTIVSAVNNEIVINNGERETKTRDVVLELDGPDNVTHMRIANDPLVAKSKWEPFVANKKWLLNFGVGTKSVYIQFRKDDGTTTRTFTDSILLKIPENLTFSIEINGGDKETNNRHVTVSSTVSQGVESMQISNVNDFTDVDNIPVRHLISWVITENTGKKTVYVNFRDVNGEKHTVVDTIEYNQPKRFIEEGSLVKGPDSNIFYFGFDAKLHPFSSMAIYHSWFDNFNNIIKVSNSKLQEYPIGKPISVRPGTWLVKFDSGKKTYAVEPGYMLREIRSEAEAKILYGKNWQRRIITLTDIDRSFYTIREYSVADKDNDIIDSDKDGIDLKTEKIYGSSDKKPDTDNDGLSDYEEIFYWFSDPGLPDTDRDGITDLVAILGGKSPIGAETLKEIPEGTYTYPFGSVVFNNNTKHFEYYYDDETIRDLGTSSKSSVFEKNNLHLIFLASPDISVPRFTKVQRKITKKHPLIYYPTTILHRNVVTL